MHDKRPQEQTVILGGRAGLEYKTAGPMRRDRQREISIGQAAAVKPRGRGDVLSANPMLALTIWQAQTDTKYTKVKDGTLLVAVHAWYEGHVDEHIQRGVAQFFPPPEGDCPSPPFPGHDDQKLYDIVDRARKEFHKDAPAVAVLAFAAGLAWNEGFQDGKKCPGCVPPGDPEFGANVRVGRGVDLEVTIDGRAPNFFGLPQKTKRS